jgi:multiple sugar transport system ATP-binding protein
MTSTAIAFERAVKTFPDGTDAVDELDLEVQPGEFMVLVGPSGCGKSTALRMVAGLEEVTRGAITIDGLIVNDVAPKARDVAMVFQNYALYPHMTVYDNLAFGLRLRKQSKDEIRRRVHDAARMLDLEPLLKRRPAALSGGQRQRVAMGRALVRQPKAFLMDEPLSNLDAKLRVQMRAEIAQLQREVGATTIYVTHDQVEAMTMGDRVAVMRAGRLQQVDAPETLYAQPTNLFVAGFIGSPAMNFIECGIRYDTDTVTIEFADQTITLSEDVLKRREGIRRHLGERVIVGIRPEDFEDAALNSSATHRLRARVDVREALGAEVLLHFRLNAPAVSADDVLPEGELETARGEARFVARIGPDTQTRAGDEISLSFDTDDLHFFDRGTHEAIS